MFGFIKKCFFTGLAFLSSLTGVNWLICISLNNQECKVRPQIVNVNSKEPVFFSFSIKTRKYFGILTVSMIHMQNCVFLML